LDITTEEKINLILQTNNNTLFDYLVQKLMGEDTCNKAFLPSLEEYHQYIRHLKRANGLPIWALGQMNLELKHQKLP
jgi:hypothetical protein